MPCSPYVWLIDRDHLDKKDMVSIGPSQSAFYVDGESQEKLIERIKTNPKVKQFRLFDDDGILYYSGYYVGLDGEFEFAPLDDFGMPHSGCTEIHYLEDGEWKQL